MQIIENLNPRGICMIVLDMNSQHMRVRIHLPSIFKWCGGHLLNAGLPQLVYTDRWQVGW